MHLDGSCHCRAVRFSLESRHPVPYQRCYCSICRKTQGGGGYAVNLAGDADTLQVQGAEHTTRYHAVMRDDAGETRSNAERVFCSLCGSALWLFDDNWPELIHPFASAIDTALPVPPQRTHLMLDAAPAWAEPELKPSDRSFGEYPEESIADWHGRLGLEAD